MKLWGGRFNREQSSKFIEFETSISFDFRLAEVDIEVNRAWAKMLARIEILDTKELKKILSCSFDNFVKVDDEGIPHYLVNYILSVAVYFSANDQFASSISKENKLTPNPIYDIFYPLIRNEIPPNIDNLLDVQTAQLLALIPEGAFIADSQGATFLLWEGDQVYLGYLTEIDYELNEVNFVLNKGGIIEKITLTLEKEKIE